MKTTVVGMIYKSTQYLDFMMSGIHKYCPDCDCLIVANDPSPAISNKLIQDGIKHVVYKDRFPHDYYLNRVYRAWNYGAQCAEGDVVVFINSDMSFTPNWLRNLLFALNHSTIPCSVLVESGKLVSGQHAITRNFGTTAATFNEPEFLKFAASVSKHAVQPGGLFMPCAFYRDQFITSGGYPEGNIYEGGVGKNTTRFLESGDYHFFYKNPVMSKKQHVTVFDSVVYHIQEGEKDE